MTRRDAKRRRLGFPHRLGGPGCKSLINPGNPNTYVKTGCFAVPTAPDHPFYDAHCDPHIDPDTGVPVFPFPLCPNLRGNAGRNILIGPGITSLDFSVFKTTALRESPKLSTCSSGLKFSTFSTTPISLRPQLPITLTFSIRREEGQAWRVCCRELLRPPAKFSLLSRSCSNLLPVRLHCLPGWGREGNVSA